ENAVGRVRERRARRAAATSGAADQVRRGQRIIRSLDPAVRVTLIGDAGKLAGWRSLTRLGRVPGGRPPGAPSVPAASEAEIAPLMAMARLAPVVSAGANGTGAPPGAESTPTGPEMGAA